MHNLLAVLIASEFISQDSEQPHTVCVLLCVKCVSCLSCHSLGRKDTHTETVPTERERESQDYSRATIFTFISKHVQKKRIVHFSQRRSGRCFQDSYEEYARCGFYSQIGRGESLRKGATRMFVIKCSVNSLESRRRRRRRRRRKKSRKRRRRR